jgi:site-specific DNA-methyltransferase (adenine-specific)
LERDPTLAAVTDKKTAVKLARRAAQRFENERTAGVPTTFEANDIYLGDSTDILKQMPGQSVDYFITDPPWIRFFEKSLTLDARTLPVFQELYRVLKTGAVGYIFCGLDDWDYYVGHDEPNPEDPSERIHTIGRLERIGFSVSKTPVIWQKLKSLSRRGVAPWEYARDFEFIIVVAKPPSVLTSARQLSGIKAFDQVHPSAMIHPNEKPVLLIEDIVKDCSYEGNVIIDPFAGSGVLGSACKNHNSKYILNERDPQAHSEILKRLGKEE